MKTMFKIVHLETYSGREEGGFPCFGVRQTTLKDGFGEDVSFGTEDEARAYLEYNGAFLIDPKVLKVETTVTETILD